MSKVKYLKFIRKTKSCNKTEAKKEMKQRCFLPTFFLYEYVIYLGEKMKENLKTGATFHREKMKERK